MADTEVINSNLERLHGRLKERYPDLDTDDREAVAGRIHDDYDEYDGKVSGYEDEINNYKGREEKLAGLLNSNGPGAAMLTGMARGEDPLEIWINQIGIDGVKECLEDPENLKKYAESNKQFLERVAKNEELEKEWEQNFSETLSMLERKRDELGLTDEQVDAAADKVRDIMLDSIRGVITEETFDMMLKALNYDTDVAEAGVEGEIRGRNQKIEAQMSDDGQSGDGLPVLGGANNTAAPKRAGSIFDLADEAR